MPSAHFRFGKGSGHPAPAGAATASGCTTRACCRSYRRLVETARAGRPARGHLRHRHPRRRHQRADPHRAAHRADQVRRSRSSAVLQGARVPPDRRSRGPGRASTPPARRRAGARARDRERQGRWPRPATTRRSAARWCARSRPRGRCRGREATFDRLVDAEPEPLTSRCGSTTRWCSTCSTSGRASRPPCVTLCSTTTSSATPARLPSERAHPRRRSRSTAPCSPDVVERLPRAGRDGRTRPARPSTCSRTSRSTSRCRPSPWPCSRCSTRRHRATRSTS